MHRSSTAGIPQPPRRQGGGQGNFVHPYVGTVSPSTATNKSPPGQQADPGVIGQPPQRSSSGTLLGPVDRLKPLTPIHPSNSSTIHDKRRSTPNPLTIFTTSPATSEQDSPFQSQFESLERSFSQTSLNTQPYPSRPRTPTPSSAGMRGKGRAAPRSSSVPSSPKSRKSPHPYGKPSVKHLTCFWWKVKGDCRFSEEDCLYAHHDTGLLADAPRQVTPGGKSIPGNEFGKSTNNLVSQNPPKLVVIWKKHLKISVQSALSLHLL
jgi:hypothetical protein